MKKLNIKNLAVVFAFLVTLTVFSSCHRGGQGCPTNFSLDSIVNIAIIK